MGKDPAFLFYTQDFLTGTIFMTYEETGKYIKLLCAQHQHGGLIDKISFRTIVGDSKLLKDRFIETEDGYYNERLTEEMIKRERKSTNLSANAKKRWSMQKQSNCITKEVKKHMPIEIENEIYIISNILLSEIKKRKPDFKEPAIDKWAHEIDLMVRVDKRKPSEIKEVIVWCQQDEFWKNNILSTAKLRKQYDQLALKMAQSKNKGGNYGSKGNYKRNQERELPPDIAEAADARARKWHDAQKKAATGDTKPDTEGNNG